VILAADDGLGAARPGGRSREDREAGYARFTAWPVSTALGPGLRHNSPVRIERARPNVFRVTATGAELSALVAGARLALDVMRAAPDPPADAIAHLERVLADFDQARSRLTGSAPDDAGS
jgi:hypothetical protein